MILLKAILSKNKFSIIIMMFMLGFGGYKWLNHRAYINYLNGIIDQVHINELRMAEEDSLAQIEHARVNAELEGLLLMEKEEKLKWKSQYFEILDAKQDTTETGGIRVRFERENPCMGIKGYTVTATELKPAYSIVNISPYPIKIRSRYMTVGDKVVGIIRPENDCVKFEKIRFEVPPSMLKKKQPQMSLLKPFVVGGIVGSAITLLLTR